MKGKGYIDAWAAGRSRMGAMVQGLDQTDFATVHTQAAKIEQEGNAVASRRISICVS